MANHTRTNGANARAQSWEDFEEQAGGQRRSTWSPLDILEEQSLSANAALHALPNAPSAPRRSIFGPRVPERAPIQPTKAHPKQVARQEQRAQRASGKAGAQTRVATVVAGAALTLMAAYAVISTAVDWTQIRLNDVQYGRPRTMQIDAFVGHNEVEGTPSHFIAMNLNRRVTVLEMPGGDSTKASAIIGPYLFGKGEDLTPVQIAAQDVNTDDKPDLIVSVKNEQLIYLNDGASFKLMTPEERQALQKALAEAIPSDTSIVGSTPEAGK